MLVQERRSASLVASLLLLAGCATPDSSSSALSVSGLPRPNDAADCAYLGLAVAGEPFELGEVAGEVLVVDVFDMYCHVCQQTAPAVNDLYESIRARGLGDHVRFLGIGFGNTSLEADSFRRKLKVPFPTISDRSRWLGGKFDDLRPPLLLALRGGQERPEVLFRHEGFFTRKEAPEFADAIIRAARLDTRQNLPSRNEP